MKNLITSLPGFIVNVFAISFLSLTSFSQVPEKAIWVSTRDGFCDRPGSDPECYNCLYLEFTDADGNNSFDYWKGFEISVLPSGSVTSSTIDIMTGKRYVKIRTNDTYTGDISIRIRGLNCRVSGCTEGPWSSSHIVKIRLENEPITAPLEGPEIVLQGNTYRYQITDNFSGYYAKVYKNGAYVKHEYFNQYSAMGYYYGDIDFQEYTGNYSLQVYGQFKCGSTQNYVQKNVHVVSIPATPGELSGRTSFKSGETARFRINNYDSNAQYYWDIQPGALVTKNQNSDGTCDLTFNNVDYAIIHVRVRAVLNGYNGPYSPVLQCSVAAAPASPSIEGPESVCYSEYKNQFLYNAVSSYAVTWAVTGTGATIQPSGKSAMVTISSSTTQFQVKAKAGNGFIESVWTTKNVTVANGQVDIDFGDINPCSGQGSIHLTGIEPSGGIYWVQGREITNTFYASQYLQQYSTSPVAAANQVTIYYGQYYQAWYENILKFNVGSIPSNADIIEARLIMHVSTGSLQDVRGIFGKLNSTINSGSSNASYENAKDPAYDIDVYEINGDPNAFELDVTDLVTDWVHGTNYGVYLDPQTNPNTVQFYTHLASNTSQKPKLEVTYSLDNTINTNVPGTNYPISYKFAQGACYSQESTTVSVLQAPTVSFNAPEFCSDEIPENLSGGNSNLPGSGHYSGNDVNNNIFYNSSPGSYDVSYIFTATNGCTSQATDQVIVHARPDFTIISVNALCGGNQIVASIPNGSSYTEIIWNVNGQIIRNVTSVSFTPPRSFSGYKHLEVDVTDLHGCSNTLEKDIEIFETPVLALNDRTECLGTFLQYYPDHVHISEGNLRYLWSTGATTDHINILVQNPRVYSLTVTSDNSCSASDQMNILALDLPQVSVDDEEICFGESVTLSAVPYIPQWQYRWDVGQSGNEITLVPSKTGSNNYTVWVTDQNRCMNSATAEVYVNALPEFTLMDRDACFGVPVTITAPPGYRNYIWSNGATGTSVITLTPFSSQTISCTVEDFNGCRNTESMHLTVHTPATFSLEQYNDDIFCYGSTATLTGPDGYQQYHWSTGATTRTVQFPLYTPGNYSLTVTNSYGCDANDAIFVQVRNLPVVTINSPTICRGNQATLVATPTNYQVYSWSHGAFGYSASVSPVETTTYYVTVTDNLGCNASFSTNVTVNPKPSFTVPDQIACYGETVTITASGSFPQYLWSTGENGSSITVVARQTASYSCTATNIYGCSSTEEMTLTVMQPTPLSMGDVDACQGDIVTLVGPPGFSYYRWSNGVEYPTLQVVADQTRNYTLEVVDINGCENSSTFTVFANPYPFVEIADFGMNQGETRIVRAPSGYPEYLWSTGHIDNFIEISPRDDTYYWVRVTTSKNCSATDTFLVYVYDLPEIEMEDQEVCQGESLRLEAPEGFISYHWSAGGQTWEGRIIYVSPGVTAVFNLEVTNEYGGVGGTNFVVTVNEMPAITCEDTLICFGDQVTLTTQTGYESYLWSTGATTNSITVSPNTTTNYRVYVTSENGCTSQREITVFVDNPFTEFTASMTAIRPGDPVQFVVNSINPIHSYFWNFGDGSDGRGSNTIHYYYNEGIFDISLTITSENQCSSVNEKEGFINVNQNNPGLSVEDPEPVKVIRLYPNPVTDRIFIDTREYMQESALNLSLFTVSGKMLLNQRINTGSIVSLDMSTMYPGAYIVKITVRDTTFSKKLIKVE